MAMNRSSHPDVMLTALLVALFAQIAAAAPASQSRPTPAGESFEPQRATPEDMKIMAPYIGTFRSPTQLFDDGKTEHYFTVSYEWFDRARTIVKFTVSMVIPSQDRTLVNSEGFYGFDPFEDRLYVFGAFTRGMTGWGAMCRFDHDTGARAVCARSKTPDGNVVSVRDTFEPVNADSWRNRTWVREGEEGEWKPVHEGIYTRIASP